MSWSHLRITGNCPRPNALEASWWISSGTKQSPPLLCGGRWHLIGQREGDQLDPSKPLSKSVAVFQINPFNHLNFEVSQLPINKKKFREPLPVCLPSYPSPQRSASSKVTRKPGWNESPLLPPAKGGDIDCARPQPPPVSNFIPNSVGMKDDESKQRFECFQDLPPFPEALIYSCICVQYILEYFIIV